MKTRLIIARLHGESQRNSEAFATELATMLESLEQSDDAKRIAALKDIIKIYELEYGHFAKCSE